ncbi:hypothetical protein LCGC14_1032900 [marine sediment metagenome]|uniref:site-specific DNA-methyltransferase (adenine-specific) n=1 Tax=marine sediment metagenome TaxID=412755 RepID=A0A0F9QC86_9ZZZZ
MRECGVTRLKDAPNFQLNLACGDSLLHGSANGRQQVLGFHELAHHYQSEDIEALKRILKPGQYHAVVANPPYITVKDRALNQAYRQRYPIACYRKYSLSAPFMQRLFDLNCEGGFAGQITANSFMKREFGKKLVEDFVPKIDLSHVVDTSGAYIPGHGTPTVLLFGRNRAPIAPKVRAVMGIKGEPATPADPAHGLVWSAIIDKIDRAGTEDEFVSVVDTERERFHKHPWSIGGGGAAELKTLLDDSSTTKLGKIVTVVGFGAILGEDEAFGAPREGTRIRSLPGDLRKPLVEGELVRDWGLTWQTEVLFPYTAEVELRDDDVIQRWMWPFRALMAARLDFSKKTYAECGRPHWEYHQIPAKRNQTALAIIFAHVATHNHFVFDRGGKVFNRSAPMIKLGDGASEDQHLEIVGLLNSALACFWMKQVFHNKGSTVDQHGARQRTDPFEDFWDHDGTKLKQLPIPSQRPLGTARRIDQLSRLLWPSVPAAMGRDSLGRGQFDAGRAKTEGLLLQMMALQEELDWECYRLYGLVDDPLQCEDPPPIKLGQRAFEIVLARRVAAGGEETTWFTRHNSTPITKIPAEWPEEYKQVVQRRIEIIESDRNIGLIERPAHKRRWNIEPWEQQQEKALGNWLLDRLASYFDLDGRMNDDGKVTAHASLRQPRLTSIAQMADIARADGDFMQIAELYRERADFDIGALVAELIEAGSVPQLPILRYKPSGLDKRAAWERTWELQRLEDDIDALFEIDRLNAIRPEQAEQALRPAVWALGIDDARKQAVLTELVSAAKNLANIVDQKLNLANEDVIKPITDAAKRAKAKAVGDIPVPPRYRSSDFISTGGARYWALRGKLDVPKERWVSFPHCEGEDGSGVIAWAGYDHLQLAQSIAERFENARQHEGRTLVPLLASLGQLIPWLKQWHNEMDPTYGTRLGDFFESHLETEAKALNMTPAEAMAWTPPAGAKKTRKRRKKVGT